MRADRAKQLLKNGVYRAIGETVSGAGGLDGEAERTLRVLMYHKVNDLQPNPTTVPTAVFAEQMALLDDLGYAPVSLEQVRDHYVDGAPLPPGAVLITFDDGYRDNLENALPILQRHGYPAVIFVPIGFLDGDRPLPHEEALRTLGVRNETVGWDELAALEAGGIRVESHGIGHRPVSELEPAEAAREIALSKLRLEAAARAAGRRVRVRQGLARRLPPRARESRAAGRLHARVHVGLRRERPVERPLPAASLQRRAVSAADVRARPLRRLRPHLGEGHGARHVRSARVQQGARHGHSMSFEIVRYTPEWRASLVALLARVGTTQLSDEEFTWWFDRNPGGEGIVSLAVDEGEVVGVAAMSFFKTRSTASRRASRSR